MADTIAAIATGAQVSAIGIVRMSGDDAIRIANLLFRPFVGGELAGIGRRIKSLRGPIRA